MMFPVGKKRETNENALPAYVQVFEKNGAPGGDRTHDPLLRRLPGHHVEVTYFTSQLEKFNNKIKVFYKII